MIKTTPHSTLSPQMWCIQKKLKDWFARTQIYWQEFVNLLTDLWNTKLLFDLSYKFIDGSFAFSCG